MTERVRRNDSVGYKRPPRHSRFKKGKSGNPRGRPKGSFNLRDRLEKAGSAQVTVTANGRTKKVSKFDVFIEQLVNKAAKGDAQAAKQLIPLLQDSSRDTKANPQPIQLFITEDEAKY